MSCGSPKSDWIASSLGLGSGLWQLQQVCALVNAGTKKALLQVCSRVLTGMTSDTTSPASCTYAPCVLPWVRAPTGADWFILGLFSVSIRQALFIAPRSHAFPYNVFGHCSRRTTRHSCVLFAAPLRTSKETSKLTLLRSTLKMTQPKRKNLGLLTPHRRMLRCSCYPQI